MRFWVTAATALVALAYAGPAFANEPPRVEPIQATFVDAERSTFYRVPASDPEGGRLTYSWKLQPSPREPQCTQFGPTALRNQVVWRHGAEHGCTHPTTNHEGVVTVDVSDGVWVCTATYRGTNTGVGDPVGPCEPAPCAPPPGFARPFSKTEAIGELGKIGCALGEVGNQITSAHPDDLIARLGDASSRFHRLLNGLPKTRGVNPGVALSSLAQADADLAASFKERDPKKLREAAARLRRLARGSPLRIRLALVRLAVDIEVLAKRREDRRVFPDDFDKAVNGFIAKKKAIVRTRYPRVHGVPMIDYLEALEQWDRRIRDAQDAAFFGDGLGLQGLLEPLFEILDKLRTALRR